MSAPAAASASGTFGVEWHDREPPLTPAAVAAVGSAVPPLAARAATRQALGARLRGAAGKSWLVLLGATEELPWAPGVMYLGIEDGLLVPTTRRPWPPASLLRLVLAGSIGDVGLLAVLPETVLTSPAPIRPVAVDTLHALAHGGPSPAGPTASHQAASVRTGPPHPAAPTGPIPAHPAASARTGPAAAASARTEPAAQAAHAWPTTRLLGHDQSPPPRQTP